MKPGFTKLFLLIVLVVSPCAAGTEVSTTEATQIAEEAYIYAFPLLQNYKTMYFRSIAPADGTPARPFNRFFHRRNLLGPDFKTIVGPNNDTLYSSAWLDLRREPLLIKVPRVEDSRYFSLQFIDAHVFNFGYVGQRTTGNQAGNFLVHGPGHDPKDYSGIDQQLRSESEFVFVIGRILASGEDDIKAVNALQDQLEIMPLSQFTAETPPQPVADLAFPKYDAQRAESAGFIEYFNFMLSLVEIDPAERHLFKRFSRIGIQPCQEKAAIPAELETAINQGVKEALQKIISQSSAMGTQVNGWNSTFEGFGSRESISNQYLLRAAAAKLALYGNDREENSGFSSLFDSAGLKLDGASGGYTITFPKNQLPPAAAFWSLTMYRLPEVLLNENSINRYSIGDRTDGLQYRPDGSLTLLIQHDAPAAAQQSNWLPAPAGPFVLSLRIYLPTQELLEGRWQPPPIVRFD